ncbi:MAG: hypothetical protein ABIZ64_03995 [Casimicrobium sp.]
MSKLFDKLNLKAHREILVVNAPLSFESELAALAGVTVLRDPRKVKKVRFGLAFASTQAEVDRLAKLLCDKVDGDALLWFAYPKGTSKNYVCEFNRDSGWSLLKSAGFDTVRAVAIDEDWTALRFRRVEFIKSTTRKSAQ